MIDIRDMILLKKNDIIIPAKTSAALEMPIKKEEIPFLIRILGSATTLIPTDIDATKILNNK